MKTRMNKTTLALCLVLSILFLADSIPVGAATVLPEGLIMEDTFRPGRGRPVGKVQQVQGDVVIMHGNVLKGYKAARGTRLYKDDTVMTLESGRVRFKLNDGSILSLASETKLKLTKSVYDKKKKRRSSFLQMALGKARFFVVKVLDFKRSEFKVKTPTAVCGVRGSDFILEATGAETIATALVDTELEFQSLEFIEETPTILKDFETSSVKLGQRASKPAKLPEEKINRMKKVFIDVESDADSDTDEGEDIQTELDDDTGVDDVGELGDEMDLEKASLGDVGPEIDFKDRIGFSADNTESVTDDIKESVTESNTESVIDDIKESVIEEIIHSELPEFPYSPIIP